MPQATSDQQKINYRCRKTERWIQAEPPVAPDTAGRPRGGHWLLVRRQVQPAEGTSTRELAFYRCAGPAATPLRELIRLAGARWAIEECFQTAKNEAGLELETAATEIDEVTHQPAHFRM